MGEDRYIRVRGDGVNPNRYRVRSGEPHEVSLYVDVRGEHTLAELVAYLLDHAQMRPDMGNVTLRGGCYRSTSPATPEDVEEWEAGETRRAEFARESRRKWYERLRAEFDPTPPAQPAPSGAAAGSAGE